MKQIKHLAYKFRLNLNHSQEKTFTQWAKTTKYMYNLALNYSETYYETFRRHHSYDVSEPTDKELRYKPTLIKLPDYGTKSFDLEIFEKHPKEYHIAPQFNPFNVSKYLTEILKEIRPIYKKREFENFVKNFYRYKENRKVSNFLDKMRNSRGKAYIKDFLELLDFLEKKESDSSCCIVENLSEKSEFFQQLKKISENPKDFTEFCTKIKQYFKIPQVEGSEYDHFLFLVQIPRQCLDNAVAHLQTAYKNFFKGLKTGRRVGLPQYKNHQSINSFQINDNGSETDIELLDKLESCKTKNFKKAIREVRLTKIGNVKFLQHKPIKGKIKNVTVSNESSHWYISFCCENIPLDDLEKEKNLKAVMNIAYDKKVVTVDENHNIQTYQINLEKIHKLEKKIKIEQKKLKQKLETNEKFQQSKNCKQMKSWPQSNPSKCKKNFLFSNSCFKTQEKINKLKLKIKNIRRDFLHQTSYKITHKYSFIIKRNLQTKNLDRLFSYEEYKKIKQKDGLSPIIPTQSSSLFQTMLEYKGKLYDCEFKQVELKITDKKCNQCGFDFEEQKGIFYCQNCGYHEDIEIYNAKHILKSILEEKE